MIIEYAGLKCKILFCLNELIYAKINNTSIMLEAHTICELEQKLLALSKNINILERQNHEYMDDCAK